MTNFTSHPSIACAADKEVIHVRKIPNAMSGSDRMTNDWNYCSADAITNISDSVLPVIHQEGSFTFVNQAARAINSSYAIGGCAASVIRSNESVSRCCYFVVTSGQRSPSQSRPSDEALRRANSNSLSQSL
jgi:hypothetical protein